MSIKYYSLIKIIKNNLCIVLPNSLTITISIYLVFRSLPLLRSLVIRKSSCYLSLSSAITNWSSSRTFAATMRWWLLSNSVPKPPNSPISSEVKLSYSLLRLFHFSMMRDFNNIALGDSLSGSEPNLTSWNRKRNKNPKP